MVTMLISQYVQQEHTDTLYVLESDNTKMDTTFQYLEEMVLSIRHNTGLRSFFRAGVYQTMMVNMRNCYRKKNESLRCRYSGLWILLS